MKTVATLVIALLMLGLAGVAVLAQNGNDLFSQALVKEKTGSYEDAIKLYQTIVQKYASDKKLAAKAWFQMGQAYEKLGSAEARKTYERVVREFADQRDVAADAGRRLAILSVPVAMPLVIARNEPFPTSISLDGKWMSFLDPSGDVAVRDMTTGRVTRLRAKAGSSDDPGKVESPAVFSPNSRQIAFPWFTGQNWQTLALPSFKNGEKKQTDDVSSYQIRVVNNEVGAKPQVLVNNPEYVDLWASWFPDGKSILVTAQRRDQTWQLLRVSTSDGKSTLIKSLDWRLGAFFETPSSVSPDGRYVTYSAFPNNPTSTSMGALGREKERHIYVLHVDGSGLETAVVKTASVNDHPIWTADGGHILFVSNLSGKSDLWAVAVRDGKSSSSPTLIRRDIGESRPIGVTVSGSVYYRRSRSGIEQVSIAELTPGGGSRVTQSFVGVNPRWSPDGRSVAFSRRNSDEPSPQGNHSLLVRSIGTGDEKVYTKNTSNGSNLMWFHDGTGVLQDVVLPGRPRVLNLIDVRSGEFNEFFTTNSDATALSPDDKTLYLLSRPPQGDVHTVIAVDLGTKQQKQIATLTANRNVPGGLAVSPDGLLLAITTLDSKTREGRLVLIRTDGTGYREIYAPFGAAFGFVKDRLAWAKDSRSILFATNATNNSNNDWQIMRIGIDGGKPESTGLTVKALESFDLSPDGSRIAFGTGAAGNSTTELLVIDDLPSLLNDSK